MQARHCLAFFCCPQDIRSSRPADLRFLVSVVVFLQIWDFLCPHSFRVRGGAGGEHEAGPPERSWDRKAACLLHPEVNWTKRGKLLIFLLLILAAH